MSLISTLRRHGPDPGGRGGREMNSPITQDGVPLAKVCAGLSERYNRTTSKDYHDPDNLMWRNDTEDYCSTALGLRPPPLQPSTPLPTENLPFVYPYLPHPSVPSHHRLLQEGCQDSTNLTPSSDFPGIICRQSLSPLCASHCFSASDLSHILLGLSSLRARTWPPLLVLSSCPTERPSLVG